MTPPERVHFDLIQGRIESAVAVDEQNLAYMMGAHVPMPPKPPLLPRHVRLDLNQIEWYLTGFCMARGGVWVEGYSYRDQALRYASAWSTPNVPIHDADPNLSRKHVQQKNHPMG